MTARSTVSPGRPWLGLSIVVVVLALLGVPLLLPLSVGTESEFGIFLAIALVGLLSGLLVAKRPDHPISWVMTATAVAGGIAGVSASTLPPGLTEPAWWQNVLAVVSGPAWYSLLFMVLLLIPLLFPTGAPVSPRWRWVGWIGGAALAIMSLLWMVQEAFCTDWSPADDTCISVVPNPIGIQGMVNPEESTLGSIFFGLMLVGAIAAIASLVIRNRKAAPVERQQVKWVVFSIGFFVSFTLLLDVLWIEVLKGSEPPGYGLMQQTLWVLIPASIAVAILRYRLYEIDRIVSRTVSYAVMAVSLAVVYAGGVIGLQSLAPGSGDLAIAASTLAAASLFSPLRRRVQDWVDRRFNRRRYDADHLVEAFSARLRGAESSTTVIDDLQTVVARTLEPKTTALWVRGVEGS